MKHQLTKWSFNTYLENADTINNEQKRENPISQEASTGIQRLGVKQ